VKEQMVRDSTEVIRKAVLRMLPRNKLRDDRMLKLRIFPDEDHPFDTQPLDKFVMPPRKIREQRPRERRAAVRAQQGSSRESD
jgi:large subunit ribosomal protein L13